MRRRSAVKRTILPDPRFRNSDLAKFINILMLNGKKSVAESIVYKALELASQKLHKEPVEVFDQAIQNVAPSVELKSRRVGGANYQIPIPVSPERRLALAMRWIVEESRNRREQGMILRLAAEMEDACNNTGATMKRKENVKRMADANRAFAHFRW